MTNTVPALEASTEVTDPQREEALKAAEYITVELINNVKANPPALQSAKVVAAGTFKQINSMLQTLKQAYGDAPIDCTTSAGDTKARDIRLRLKTLRTRSNKLRLEANEPYVEQIEANGDVQKMIEDTLLPLEKRYDEAIKAQEAVVAARKREAEAKAEERSRSIAAALADIVAKGSVDANETSADIAVRIQDLTILEIVAEDFDHRYGEAVTFKDQAIQRLEAGFATAKAREDRDAQIALDRATFEAERAALALIESTVVDPTDRAMSQGVDAIRATLDSLRVLDAEVFEPLVEQGRTALERSIRVLTTTLDAKVKEAAEATARAEQAKLDAAEQAKRAQEQKARDGIAKMQADVAKCVTAGSAIILLYILEMKDLNLASFEPLAREAAEVQAECLKSLEALRVAALAREEEVIERNRKQLIAENIDTRILMLGGMAARHEAAGTGSEDLTSLLNDYVVPTAEQFGERVEEAKRIAEEQRDLIIALRDKRAAAEKTAREEAAERKRVAEEQAAAQAKQSRTVRALATNSPEMFGALAMVSRDEGFGSLSEATRRIVDELLKKIETAIEG